MRLIAPLLALALAVAPLPVLAASQNVTVLPTTGQEAKDEAVVRKVIQAGSLKAAATYEGELNAVLAHAPARYPQIDRKPEMTLVRSISDQAGLGGAVLIAGLNTKDGKSSTTATSFNTYAMAALLLGSIANERRDPRGAIAYLDKGLALQPDNLMLITEKGAAMTVLQRYADALALYESAENIDFITKLLDPGGEARLQRGKGFVLIELKRLDEAEAAYEAALKLEPNHAGARGELDYIRKLRAGGKQAPIGLFTSDTAQTGDPTKAKPLSN